MDKIDLTKAERDNVAMLRNNMTQCETQMNAWKAGLTAVLNTILGRSPASSENASFALSPDGTALVREPNQEAAIPVGMNGLPATPDPSMNPETGVN